MSKWKMLCRLCKEPLQGTVGPHCPECLPKARALGRSKAALRRVLSNRDKQGRFNHTARDAND